MVRKAGPDHKDIENKAKGKEGPGIQAGSLLCAASAETETMKLIDWIFRKRNRRRYLEAQSHLLTEMNHRLCTGESVQLTVNERKLIQEAIEDPHFKERVELPQTKKGIRIIRNDLREKIRASLKEKP